MTTTPKEDSRPIYCSKGYECQADDIPGQTVPMESAYESRRWMAEHQEFLTKNGPFLK